MSGTKRVIMPFMAIENGDMSGNITGKVSDTAHMDYASYIAEWSGTGINGKLVFDGMVLDSQGTLTWKEIDFGGDIVLSGDAKHDIIFNKIPFAKIRPRYVRTGGTGTLNVYAIVKED